MYADATKVRLQPGKADEGIELWRNTLLPELRQHEGLRGDLVMGDSETDKGLEITL